MSKERLDIILVRRGLFASREKARQAVLAGNICVDGRRADKAGAALDAEHVSIEVKGTSAKYVSRGGLKLEKAVEVFALNLKDKICMDIGASTGGFTDCMLQNGAAKVYAIDVGHGQLDQRLRENERVVNLEGINFRYMTPEAICEAPEFASADVSFISLTKILPPARALLGDKGQMVCLVKPQFEAGRENVGKKGVVRDKSVHRDVLGRILDYADSLGFHILGLDFSPVRGPEGNIEYLLFLQKDAAYRADMEQWRAKAAEVADNAHRALE